MRARRYTHTHLGLLDRDQLLHGLGLNLHLFEGMLGAEELAVNLVRGKETYIARENRAITQVIKPMTNNEHPKSTPC